MTFAERNAAFTSLDRLDKIKFEDPPSVRLWLAHTDNRAELTGLFIMAMSVAEEIILCVGYAIIFIANIVGNLLVCAVVLKTKYLQNFTSILIVNMAVGDLIVGASGVLHIVLEVWFLVSGNNKNTVFCGRLNGITFFSASISIYTMAVLAYDRYLAIVKPVIRRGTLTKGKLKIVLPAIWILSLVFLGASMYFIDVYDFKNDKLICWETLPQDELPVSYRIIVFVAMYLIPMCTTMYFFGKIFIHLWWIRNPPISRAANQVLLKSRKHLTKILGSVILLFNICWLPWFVVELLLSFDSALKRHEVLQSALALLAVAHSSSNPFIYSFQSQNFRQHIRRITKRNKPELSKEKTEIESSKVHA